MANTIYDTEYTIDNSLANGGATPAFVSEYDLRQIQTPMTSVGGTGTDNNSSAGFTLGWNRNDNDSGNDRANGPYVASGSNSNNQGFNVLANSHLRIEGGSTVQVSTMGIFSTFNEDSDGGQVTIDGSKLIAARIPMQGRDGSSNPFVVGTNDSERRYPTLNIINGGQVNLPGCSGNDYRAFNGIHGRGRLVIDDGALYFGADNAAFFRGYDSVRPVWFTGTQTNLNNAVIDGFSRIEVSGAIQRMASTSLTYGQNVGLADNNGVFYGTSNGTIANFGDFSVTLPPGQDVFPSTGGVFKMGNFREAGQIFDFGGQMTVVTDSDTFEPACHHFVGHPTTTAGADIYRQFRRSGTLNASAVLVNEDFTPSSETLNGRFTMLDNYGNVEVPTQSTWTNGAMTPQTYTWYYQPWYGTDEAPTTARTQFGYSNLKQGGSYTSRFFRSQDANGSGNLNTMAAYSRAFQHGDTTQTFVLASFQDVRSSANQVHQRRDQRRHYPFRAGFHQWGFKPEFTDTGLGESTQPPQTGNPTLAQLQAAENSCNDIRNGKSLTYTAARDPLLVSGTNIVSLTSAANAHMTESLEADNTRASYSVVDSDVSLDKVYRHIQQWTYHRAFADTENFYTPGTLNNANAGWNLTIDYDETGLLPVNNIGFYNFVPSPGASTRSMNVNSDWADIRAIKANTNVRLWERLRQAESQGCNWLQGYMYCWRDNSNWALLRFERDFEQRGAANSEAQAQITEVVASQGNIGSSGTVRIQIANYADSFFEDGASGDDVTLTITHPWRDYLWQSNVGLRPADSNTANANMETSYVRLRQDSDAIFGDSTEAGHITPGTQLTSVDLTTDSDIFDANARAVRISTRGNGRIINLPTNSTSVNPTIAAGTTHTSTIQFARGSTYTVAGDLTGATLVAVGTGANPMINLTGSGAVPASLTGIDVQKTVGISLVAPIGWDSNVIDSEAGANIAAYAGTTLANAQSATKETNPTPTLSTTNVSNDTLTYDFVIDNNDTLYWAFAGRSHITEGGWYDPVNGASSTSATVNMAVSTAIDATPNGTGADALITYINNPSNDVVGALSANATGTNKMTISLDNAAFAGTIRDGRYFTRLIMQKDHFLENVAKTYYPVNGIVIQSDRIIYNDDDVTWQKAVGNNNVVSFAIQVQDAQGGRLDSGANAITTNNVTTRIAWSGPAAIGFVDPTLLASLATSAELEPLAKESSVWAANAAL